jgi:hypothetical protein
LTPADEAAIVREAGWRSLRRIARDHGCSHEAVRLVLKRALVEAPPAADADAEAITDVAAPLAAD